MAKTLRKEKNRPKKETPVQLQDALPKVQLDGNTVPEENSVQDSGNNAQLPEPAAASLEKSLEVPSPAQIIGHDVTPAVEQKAESTKEIQPEPTDKSQQEQQSEPAAKGQASEQTGGDAGTPDATNTEETGQNIGNGKNKVFQPEPKKYLDDFRLPEGTKVISDTGTEYTVISYISSGSYANTYYVQNSEKEVLVLKEFCITGTERLENKRLDMIEDANYKVFKEKFEKEPGRVLQLFEEGKTAKNVTDEMTYDVAFNTARKEVGKGGLFTWKGTTLNTYTKEERQNLNLVLPRTKVFKYFDNYYYVMEYVEGIRLADYMIDIREGKIKKDLSLMLRIMEQLAIAVENIREIPCAHLDLSPNNVMIKIEEDGNVKLKVIDFGCAVNLNRIKRDIELKKEKPGSYIGDEGVGTPGFTDSTYNNELYKIYPESIHLIDIYSMGAILYYMTLFDVKWVDDLYEDARMNNDLKSINALPDNASQEKLNEFLYTPDEKQEDISDKEKKLRMAILRLVKEAVAFDGNRRLLTNPFDGRCQSATAFKQKLQKMLCQVRWINVNGAKVDATQTNTLLAFYTTGNWKAKLKAQDGKQPDWVSISSAKSGNGPDTITLSLQFKPNTTCTPRQATLLVQSGIWPIEVQLEQAGQTPVKANIHFPRGASELTKFDCVGGHGELTVIASKGWSADISPEGNGWLTVDVQGGKQGELIVPFHVTANPSQKKRNASIIFQCEDQSVEWKVQQDSKPQTFIYFNEDAETEHTFPSSGGQSSFRFKANEKSTLTLHPTTVAAWLQTNGREFGPGESEVIMTVMNNPLQVQREAEIHLDCDGSSICYKVKQERTRTQPVAVEPAYTGLEEPWIPQPVIKRVEDRITPTGSKHLEFDWNDQTKKTISFSCNHPWEVKMIPEAKFVKLVIDSKHKNGEPGNVQIQISVDRNDTSSGRETAIQVTAGEAICSFPIKQYPREFLKPVPQYAVFTSTGQRQELEIHASRKWGIVIPPEDRQWLSVDIPSGDKGQYRVVVTAAPNPDTKLRTTTMTIEGEKEKMAVVVSQPGKIVYTNTNDGTWKKWLVTILAAITVGAGIWFLFGEQAFQKTYALDFPDGQTLEIPHEGIEKGTWALTANDLWKAEVTEQQPDGWLSLDRSSGDESTTSFQYRAPMNLRETPKKATIKVVCGDVYKLIQVTQGIDRADSLERRIIQVNSGNASYKAFTKNLSTWFSMDVLDPATGQRQPVKYDIDEVLRNKIPAMQIGKTHDVVSFEQDKKGHIKSITLQKR